MCLNFKRICTFVIFAMSLFIINTTNYLANDKVSVYVNNTIIEFEDAEPQIINSRVMVPFRKIAEVLGATVDWNKTTETMTLTKGSLTVVHTLRSNIITVNGSAITFDTPSTVSQSRTLMPVRMIAEALNCSVDWDNDTRSVLITVDEPVVNSVTTDSSSVYDGEKVTITVNASSDAERIKVVDSNTKEVLVESYTYTTLADGSKTFSVPWTPQEGVTSVKSLQVFAGSLLSYNENTDSSKTFTLIITGGNEPNISKIESSGDTVARNDYLTLTIYTNSLTTRVKIKDNNGNDLIEVVNYTVSGSSRIFEARIKMTDRSVTELSIYPGNSGSYSNNKITFNVTVTGAGSTTSSVDKLNAVRTIYEVIISEDTVYVDEDVDFKIFTSADIYRLEIQNEDGRVIQQINFPYSRDNANNEYIWQTSLTISESGRNKYYVVAYDDDDRKVTETLTIRGETYSRNDLVILSIKQRETDAVIGETVTFTVKTTTPINYIELREGNTLLQQITNYSSSGSYRTFTFKIKLTSSNVNNLKVIAYDAYNSSVSQRVYPNYIEYIKPEIYEVQIKSSEVYLYDEVRISVYTNSSVSKVWVEDANENRVVLSTKCDDVSGDEYIWDLKFPAEEVGSRVLYTVYVQNDDKVTEEYSFRIKVTR